MTSHLPIFKKVDCLMLRVPDLEEGLRFYQDRLGHSVLWRTDSAIGLKLPDSDSELVISNTTSEPEVDLLVESADSAAKRFVEAGGKIVNGPFEIPIGRCVVLQDPWGYVLVALDMSKGAFVIDGQHRVVGITKKEEYRGSVIEESLKDNRVLNDIKVVRTRITNDEDPSKRWHIFVLHVNRSEIDRLQGCLRNGPWYMHFWDDKDITVVFKNRTFTLNRNNTSTWTKAIEHGRSLGIPDSQLDFSIESGGST